MGDPLASLDRKIAKFDASVDASVAKFDVAVAATVAKFDGSLPPEVQAEIKQIQREITTYRDV